MLLVDTIYCGNCVDVMNDLDTESIDLTVTSPPYDGLRIYHGFLFYFENIIKELYRVTKNGGVVVWIVGDETIKGDESGSSFRQALCFKELGFNLHDTMIWHKDWGNSSGKRYSQRFDYMFIFSKETPKTFNPIEDVKNDGMNKRRNRQDLKYHYRNKEGDIIYGKQNPIRDYRRRDNIWFYGVGNNKSTTYKPAFQHPAIFPEQMAVDHILSWSNPEDIVLDPMIGSGTVAVACIRTRRRYIGIDISEQYCNLARMRIAKEKGV